jgi:hypothetical protein
MFTILGVIVFVFSVFSCIAIWARADLPMIQREIAFNTRKDREDGPEYNAIKVLSVVYKIGAILTLFVGIIIMVLLLKYGQISEYSIPKFKI